MENIQLHSKPKNSLEQLCYGQEILFQNAHMLKIWFPTGGIIEKWLDIEVSDLINELIP